MYHARRLTLAAIGVGIFILLASVLPWLLDPSPPSPDERLRDRRWVQSSPYWADREICTWFGLCGLHHVRWDPPALSGDRGDHDEGDGDELRRIDLRSVLEDERDRQFWERARRKDRMRRRGNTQQRAPNGAKILKEVPDFVLRYAPLVHLYSGENFWPSHIEEHVKHMRPYENGTLLNLTLPVTLENLAILNKQPFPVYLTSEDNVEERPEWLHSHVGIPLPFEDGEDDDEESRHPASGSQDDRRLRYGGGSTWYDVDKEHPLQRISDPRLLSDSRHPPFSSSEPARVDPRGSESVQASAAPPEILEGHKPDGNGYSHAPAVLILVDKGSDIIDAFWFFFYSYNLGQTVFDIRFGNHVGDWEHCMVRFEGGVPRAMFLSEHAGGQAYAWQALEKRYGVADEDGDSLRPERPVIYSAVGSHAMYATSGLHPYVLPFRLLADVTDRGPLWDPALNNLAFWYDYEADRGAIAEPVEGEAVGVDEFMQVEAQVNSSAMSWARIFSSSFDRAAPVLPVDNADIPPVRDMAAEEDNMSESQLTSLLPAASNPDAPTSWFHFAGPWGDALYPLSDPRQWRLFGQYHYHTGPLGPRFKNLKREKVCQTKRCRILWSLEEGVRATWYN